MAGPVSFSRVAVVAAAIGVIFTIWLVVQAQTAGPVSAVSVQQEAADMRLLVHNLELQVQLNKATSLSASEHADRLEMLVGKVMHACTVAINYRSPKRSPLLGAH